MPPITRPKKDKTFKTIIENKNFVIKNLVNIFFKIVLEHNIHNIPWQHMVQMYGGDIKFPTLIN